MQYVIHNMITGKYLSLIVKKNDAIWVDVDKAHRFSDRSKVDNFMRMNFNNAVRGQYSRADVEILPCDEQSLPIDGGG